MANSVFSQSHSKTCVFSEPYDRVFRVVCDAAVAERMTVRSAEPESGHVHLTTGISIWSPGESIGVTLRPVESDVEVTVYSALRFVFFGNSGVNRENVRRLFRRIEELLARSEVGWHLDPSGRHELRWWDGSGWTEQVSDGGRHGVDRM